MLRTRSDDFAMRWGLFFLAICVVLAITDGHHSDHKHKISFQRSSSQSDARIDNIKEVLFGPEGKKGKQISASDPASSGGSFEPTGESSGGSIEPTGESSGGSLEPTGGSSGGSVEPTGGSSGSSVEPTGGSSGGSFEPTEDPTSTTTDSSASDSSEPEDILPQNPLVPKLLLKANRHASRKLLEDKHLQLS